MWFPPSCASKSILRSVVDQICSEEEGVYYFPSYEIVNILAPLQGIPAYKDDGHHVQRNIVKNYNGDFSRKNGNTNIIYDEKL